MSLYKTGVREVVDNYLIEESKKIRDYGDYWSASSAGYCMRRNMFERLKVPHVTEDARKQRVFTVGHIFHQFIQELTQKAGISVAQEIELKDEELMILGHADDLVLVPHEYTLKPLTKETAKVTKISKEEWDNAGVLESPDTSHIKPRLILYDYKSQSSRAFSYKRPNMSYFHRMQLATYMYMLRQPTQNWTTNKDFQIDPKQLLTLSEARILKISKDDLRMSEEVLNWSDDLQNEVLNYWKTLNKYWADKKFPPCTCADKEGGFLAKEAYNPFYYEGEPCSMAWFMKNKEARNEKS